MSIKTILCVVILGVLIVVVTGCTTAKTKSVSRPILNQDGTVVLDQHGNYPKEIIIEVEATAGPTSTLEAWMLETDIAKTADDLTFHTGSQGTGAAGADMKTMLQILTLVNQLLMKALAPIP